VATLAYETLYQDLVQSFGFQGAIIVCKQSKEMQSYSFGILKDFLDFIGFLESFTTPK